MALMERLKHSWNAFLNQPIEERFKSMDVGGSYSFQPDRRPYTYSNERSIISSIFTRICIDVAMVDIRHVRVDENGGYEEDIKSGLNYCLTEEANVDQAATAFRMDIIKALCNVGVAAIVPVDTTINPAVSGSFDIKTMRVGEIVSWYPQHVTVELYNERLGRREQLLLEKKYVAIVTNPLYDVMNEQNSTLKRIIRKLNLLDTVDEASSSGKLDMIIQLPYVIKSEARREQAQQRRKDIEFQLTGSKYGIAYTDGTEKITQLNRPAENNLLGQVEYLMEMLYGQLGITKAVMDGTADESTMTNYYNRTIGPMITAVMEEMRRKFLTKTARAQNQTVMSFRDPFQYVSLENFAEIADKFTRNEVLSANEIRAGIGIKPSKDPKADELRNSNMPQPDEAAGDGGAELAQGAFAEVNSMLDDLDKELAGI